MQQSSQADAASRYRSRIASCAAPSAIGRDFPRKLRTGSHGRPAPSRRPRRTALDSSKLRRSHSPAEYSCEWMTAAVGHVDLGEPRAQHVLGEQVILGIAISRNGTCCHAPRDAAVGIGEEPEAAEEARGGALRLPGASTSTRGPPPPRERAQTSVQLPGDAEARLGSRPIGTERQAHVGSKRERVHQSGEPVLASGTASWVRKATWSPRRVDISRLRVPPCENSLAGISITCAPWARASATVSSVEPESQINLELSRRFAEPSPRRGVGERRTGVQRRDCHCHNVSHIRMLRDRPPRRSQPSRGET